jgi:L-2-amino-thiazoline-4-carboxylic acid hydrolase
MDVPLIEQVKIQGQILVPLVKALRAELGKERANHLVRRTLGDIYRCCGQGFPRSKDEENIGHLMASAFATYARGGALDYELREQSHDGVEIAVTRCQYAAILKEIGEPELGILLVCSADFPPAEGVDPNVKLTPTRTIMQGASCCDFHYKRVNVH